MTREQLIKALRTPAKSTVGSEVPQQPDPLMLAAADMLEADGVPLDWKWVASVQMFESVVKTADQAFMVRTMTPEEAAMKLRLAPQPAIQERLPLTEAQKFSTFIEWAGSNGYDTANTCDSDTGRFIALNPMTADLWKAWQAAHGITENKP